MGVFSRIPPIEELDDDVDQAVEIGGTPPPKYCQTVMRVGLDSAKLVYIEEIPVEYSLTPYIKEYAPDRRASWRRFEYRVKRNETSIRSKECLIMAELPYSSAMVDIAKFKPPWKKRADERPQPKRAFKTAEDFIDWTERQSFDYWETDDYLTAGLSFPDSLMLRDSKAQRVFNPVYAHGVCDKIEDYFRQLLISEESQSLLKQTRDRSIPFWSLSAKLGEIPYLSDSTIDRAEVLLERSIYQALAGPFEESEKWFGRPVMDMVDKLYRDHLNDINRRKS